MAWSENLLNFMALVLAHYQWLTEQQLEICRPSTDQPVRFSQLMKKQLDI